MNRPIGISVLTSGKRRCRLESCIWSFLSNCWYRPLVFGIYDNCSTDDTKEWLSNLPEIEGVEWRVESASQDGGCAKGTNLSIDLVSDCELQIHLESDFSHMSPAESGADKFWLNRAVSFLGQNDCDYLYLRRMRDEKEAAMHWWSQWMSKIDLEKKEYLRCPGFWWSNNPVLFRLSALKETGTLPLDESKDGGKGSSGWSQPELQASRPKNTWIHKWGVFVHERNDSEDFSDSGCRMFGPYGNSGCKYGFWKKEDSPWCSRCKSGVGFSDMADHFERMK